MGSHTLGRKRRNYLQTSAGLADPGASGNIAPTEDGQICQLTSAGAETRTLEAATGYPLGFHLTLVMFYDGGDITITSAGLNATGNNTITFADEGHWIDLVVQLNASAANAWKAYAYDGAALSTV